MTFSLPALQHTDSADETQAAEPLVFGQNEDPGDETDAR